MRSGALRQSASLCRKASGWAAVPRQDIFPSGPLTIDFTLHFRGLPLWKVNCVEVSEQSSQKGDKDESKPTAFSSHRNHLRVDYVLHSPLCSNVLSQGEGYKGAAAARAAGAVSAKQDLVDLNSATKE